jgi:glycosyltransferase involved in cell wall biosynthesis
VKVLLVNQYFPPDRAATAGVAAAAVSVLAERGHEVSVLAGRPSYDVHERARWRPWRRERGHGARVVRVGSTAFDRRSLRGRVANYASYAAWTLPLAAAADADVIVGMSDPPFAGVVAANAAAVRRRPFVYWMQDLHPEFSLATGDLQPNTVVRRWQGWHRRALRRAAAVVVLGDDMARRVVDAGAPADRVHVVRSGANPLDEPSDTKVTSAIRGPGDFVVLHAGNLGQSVAWPTLIGAAATLGDPVKLVFVGGGAERAAAARAANGHGNVRFHDYWPEAQLPDVFAAGDLHAVTVRRGLEGLVVPSRLYTVLAAGRPVLAVADDASDVAALVRAHDCGVVADPDSPDAVAAAIDWARTHPAELATMGARAAVAATQYDRVTLLHRLVDLIESVAR